MDGWAYAVVDNSQKRGTGNGERGTGNLGTPVPRGGKAGTRLRSGATLRSSASLRSTSKPELRRAGRKRGTRQRRAGGEPGKRDRPRRGGLVRRYTCRRAAAGFCLYLCGRGAGVRGDIAPCGPSLAAWGRATAMPAVVSRSATRTKAFSFCLDFFQAYARLRQTALVRSKTRLFRPRRPEKVTAAIGKNCPRAEKGLDARPYDWYNLYGW
jgi:hypothetical protein